MGLMEGTIIAGLRQNESAYTGRGRQPPPNVRVQVKGIASLGPQGLFGSGVSPQHFPGTKLEGHKAPEGRLSLWFAKTKKGEFC